MKTSYEFLIQLKELHSFEISEEAAMKYEFSPKSNYRNVFHYTAMCGDHRFLRIVQNAIPKKQDFPLVYRVSQVFCIDVIKM